MKLKSGALLWAMALLILPGCFGDLDVEPNDPRTQLADDFYTDLESYRSALAGVYGNLSLTGLEGSGSSNISGLDAGTSQYMRTYWYMQCLTTDEVIWSYENDPGTAGMNRCTWNSENVIVRGFFGRSMASVAFANDFLRQSTPDLLASRGLSESDQAEVAVYRAEARFLRALSYYHLMDLFGQAPFVTEATDIGLDAPPAYDRAQLFEFVETELLDIVDQMAEPMTNEYARADKGAVWMLLAKLYLNAEVYIGQNRYSDCIAQCENLFNAGYQLAGEGNAPNYEPYLDLFRADNDRAGLREEIIFPVVSDGETVQNFGATTVMVNGSVGSLESNGLDIGVGAAGWGGALRLPRQFSEKIDAAYMSDNRNTVIYDKVVTEERSIEPFSVSDQNTGYIIEKWSNVGSDGTPGPDQTFVDTDFPMFRTADAYLMYAEAHLRGGGGTETRALELLNTIRERAGNSEEITSSDLSLDLILDERLIELYWEAHRRQDLIRFGLFTGSAYNWSWKGGALAGTGIPAYRQLFPIPVASLSSNPNLTQNEGY